jgi:hypothetical protein
VARPVYNLEMRPVTLLATTLLTTAGLLAQPASQPYPAPLPPDIPWSGPSESLIVPATDPWVTPAELSGLTQTPRYLETMAWLHRLDKASDQISMLSIGRSPEGRDLWMVIASKEKSHTRQALARSRKPLILVQAGIHSGEIDGKDAGMMLLRDMTVDGRKRDLLDAVNFLFIPIVNVDGHERFSAYNRINQKGPAETGWRTNARNLNLNRDYGKLDTPEIQAIVRVLDQWRPDLYVDVHVTDGIDYQYDVTYGFSRSYSPKIGAWLAENLSPQVDADLRRMGHIPGPLIFAADDEDVSKGIVRWAGSLRFSDGYGDARHLPTLLVENHSLKPYRERVLGTYVFLESVMRVLGREGAGLRKAIEEDRAARPKSVTLTWKRNPGEPPLIRFLGIKARLHDSPISGGKWVEWTGEKQDMTIPALESMTPDLVARRPKAYWISVAWQDVIDRLRLHGIVMERLASDREVSVETWPIADYKLDTVVNEGRVRVRATMSLRPGPVRYPAGSVRIPTDQPLGDLAVLLLEPDSPESLFQWGFFLSALDRNEYAEAYVLEPLARKMLAQDPALEAEFEKKLAEDPDFAASPQRRLNWFYQRSPFWTNRQSYYPVACEPN